MDSDKPYYRDNLRALIVMAHHLNRHTKIVADSIIHTYRRKLIESIYGNVPKDDNSGLKRINERTNASWIRY